MGRIGIEGREGGWETSCNRYTLLGLGHVDTRVRDVSALLDGDVLGYAGVVLVEYNVFVVLDELGSQLNPFPERKRRRKLTMHSRNDLQNDANMLSFEYM